MTVECVQCGYCCKKGPCMYGAWNWHKTQCMFLVETGDDRYECSVYHQIQKDQEHDQFKMFGCGCSSPLFNTYRENILKRIENEKGESKADR